MHSRIASGARNPNGAGLPMFKRTIRSPASIMRLASSITGPRIS